MVVFKVSSPFRLIFVTDRYTDGGICTEDVSQISKTINSYQLRTFLLHSRIIFIHIAYWDR